MTLKELKKIVDTVEGIKTHSGIIRINRCFIEGREYTDIHIDDKLFLELFSEYETKNWSDFYNELSVYYPGKTKIFALQEKTEEE